MMRKKVYLSITSFIAVVALLSTSGPESVSSQELFGGLLGGGKVTSATSGLERNVSRLERNVSRLESKVDSLESKDVEGVSGLYTSVFKLEGMVSTLKSKSLELTGVAQELDQALEEAQAKLAPKEKQKAASPLGGIFSFLKPQQQKPSPKMEEQNKEVEPKAEEQNKEVEPPKIEKQEAASPLGGILSFLYKTPPSPQDRETSKKTLSQQEILILTQRAEGLSSRISEASKDTSDAAANVRDATSMLSIGGVEEGKISVAKGIIDGLAEEAKKGGKVDRVVDMVDGFIDEASNLVKEAKGLKPVEKKEEKPKTYVVETPGIESAVSGLTTEIARAADTLRPQEGPITHVVKAPEMEKALSGLVDAVKVLTEEAEESAQRAIEIAEELAAKEKEEEEAIEEKKAPGYAVTDNVVGRSRTLEKIRLGGDNR